MISARTLGHILITMLGLDSFEGSELLPGRHDCPLLEGSDVLGVSDVDRLLDDAAALHTLHHTAVLPSNLVGDASEVAEL